jgi:hypothetical protein
MYYNNKLNDKTKATGSLTISVFDEHGTEKTKLHLNNLVVQSGKAFITSRMVGASPSVMSHMAIGTNTASPTSGDTTLGTEIGRVSLSGSIPNGDTITYSATFPAGVGTGSISEAGVFNANSAGTMLCRTTFLPINKSASEVIAFTWNITLS